MEKDKIFFGEDGLTTTSANHIANLAKEAYRTTVSELDSVVFYTTEIGILGSQNKNTLKEGVDDSILEITEDRLMEVAQLKSLIAWLREAIKAKERLISEANKLSFQDIAKTLGITLPEEPVKYIRLAADDVIASWGIKQRNRYYYVDTVCAVIGSYIQPGGKFADAREDLTKILTEKHKASGSGRDTVIYSYTPTVFSEEVEDTFFALQNKYREFQAELNSMNHSIEVALQKDDREKTALEVREITEYNRTIAPIEDKIIAYRKEEVRKAQALKIVIPDSLKYIYEVVSKMGK